MQGNCTLSKYDSTTQKATELISKMLYTDFELPAEDWFFKQDGKDTFPPHVSVHAAHYSLCIHPVRVLLRRGCVGRP